MFDTNTIFFVLLLSSLGTNPSSHRVPMALIGDGNHLTSHSSITSIQRADGMNESILLCPSNNNDIMTNTTSNKQHDQHDDAIMEKPSEFACGLREFLPLALLLVLHLALGLFTDFSNHHPMEDHAS